MASRSWKVRSFLLTATLLVALFAGLAATQPAAAVNPTTMSFQGKVVNANGTNVTDGTYTFVFKLYTVISGGSALWTETQSSVTVTAGVFQVNLGSSCPFFTANACNGSTPIDFNANPNLYLGITFNSDPAGEMNPRVQLQSVPFAYNADKVGGLSVSQLVQLSPGTQQTGFINVSGASTIGSGLTVTTGGATVGGTLAVTSSAAAANAALFTGAASASAPVVIVRDGATPQAGGDLLQWQNSSSVMLGAIQSDGVINMAGVAGSVQYQNAVTSLGDKLGLYASTTFGRYGLGIQANTLVAHIGATSASFTVRVDPGSGQASSGSNVFAVTGLGNVAAAGTITGTTLNGTTGINTGATGGTQRIDNTGNLLNIANLTMSGNFDQSASSGTFQTGSGAISLNGNTSITGTKTLTVGSGLTTLGGGLNVTGNINTTNGNILIQQTAAGASAIFDNLAGKIGSIKAGSAKVAFLFDNSGNFSIGSDTRTNIAASNTAGTDIITILGASGNVGIGDSTPAATFTVGAGDLFQVAGASGNVLTAGTVTGTTINGTTGINTGATAGTQRIDASGNLVNIGNLTATGTLTVTTTGSTGVNFTDGTNSLAKVIDGNVSGVNYGLLQLGAKASTGNEAAQCAAAGDVGKIYVNSTDKAVFACTAANAWEQLDNGRANQITNVGSYTVTTTNAIVGGNDTLTITPTTANSDVFVRYDADISFTSTGLGNNPGTVTLRVYRGATCAAGTLIQTSVYTEPTSGASISANVSVIDTGATAGSSNTYIVCAQRSGGAGTITDTMANRSLILSEIDITGADYAEVYYSHDGDIAAGTIITADSSIKAGVKPSSSRYQKGLIGVVSTQPGQVLSDGADSGTPVIVALAGRVPVKVSTENGPIKVGDLLTSSSIAGVAMKATKAGTIIGTAMTGYEGGGVGQVMLFVTTGQAAGSLPLTIDGGPVDGKMLLNDLMIGRAAAAEPADLSSIFTDRLAAAVEIVTPKLISDEVQTNAIVVGKDGINFKNEAGEVVASIDASGNFHGSKVSSSSLDAMLDPASATAAEPQPTLQAIDKDTVVDPATQQALSFDSGATLNLASATLSGGLNVSGDATFAGLSTFQKMATFLAKTVFRQDVQFDGHITVAKDSAGYATLRSGESSVHVKFVAAYADAPVVTANPVDGQFNLTSINNVTSEGFDINIKDPATADTKLSWTAIGVIDPQTASNPDLLQ